MKRKVLIIINSEVGGAERMSVNISKMLINNGSYDVRYVIIYKQKYKKSGTTITDFIPINHEIISIESKNRLDETIKLFQIIKKENPLIVFASHYTINYKILSFKKKFQNTKFIIRAENNYETFPIIGKVITKITYRLADVVIAQTNEMKNEYLKHKILSPEKIHVLGNPIDKDFINNRIKDCLSPFPNDGKKHIVAVGRVAYQKGYDILAEAFTEVINTNKNIELYIIGSYTGLWESEYERVLKIIKNKNLEKYIHFLGYNDNPYVYIKHSDCFVLSSRWEGLPNVLAEALYLKKPVAAFKCIPIIERMVRDGIDGFLAEKDNPQDLAQAMLKALKIEKTTPIYQGASENDFIKLF